MKQYITKTELAAALGRTAGAVSVWMRKGCPYKKVKGAGRGCLMRPVFCLEDVQEWLLSRYNRKEFDV